MQNQSQDYERGIPPLDDEGGGVAAVFHLLWSQRRVIGLAAAIGFSFMLVLSLVTKPDYSLQMIIMPPADGGSQGLLGQASSLAGAASDLAGFHFGGENISNFDAARQLLQSPRMYAEMEHRYHVLRFFFPNKWDVEHKKWRTSTNLFSGLIDFIKSIFHIPLHSVPNASDLAALMKGRITVSQIGLTNLYEVDLQYFDPNLGAEFLSLAADIADALERQDALARIDGQLAYIDQRIRSVTVAEHRTALTDLIVSLERQRMVIAGGGSYAMLVLQPPTVVGQPSVMGLLGRLILGMLGGAVLVVGVILLLPNRTRVLDEALAKWLTIRVRRTPGSRYGSALGEGQGTDE